MRVKLFLLLILLSTLTICKAQYNPFEPDSLNLENYSKKELWQFFLNMNENVEVCQLAKKSKRSNEWSIVFYSIGALYTIVGIGALSDQANGNDPYGVASGASVVGLGVGAAVISLGVWQSKKSKKRLEKAIELYEKQQLK